MSNTLERTLNLVTMCTLGQLTAQKLHLYTFLHSLYPQHRNILSKHFIALDWNIGSLEMLGTLQECRILTATKFILKFVEANLNLNHTLNALLCRQKNSEHVQLLINDFFEKEFKLLANLVVSATYDLTHSTKLMAILDEAITSLISDLLRNAKMVVSVKYMKCLKCLVPTEIYSSFKRMHIDALFSLYGEHSIKEAYKYFPIWCNELECHNSMNDLLCEISSDQKVEMFKTLFKYSTKEGFRGWKLFISLLNISGRNRTHDGDLFAKKHLKDTFNECKTKNNLNLFLNLLLSARSIFYKGSENSLDSYQQWLKQCIGDMKFVTSVSEFKTIMGNLTDAISFEEEVIYLQAHLNTGISAPALCNEIVLSYKRNCRSRISYLSSDRQSNVDHSIMLSSDDSS